MPDLSNPEIGVEGEYAYCDTCGLLFHWEQLTLTASGAYFCDDHVHEGMGGGTVHVHVWNPESTGDPTRCELCGLPAQVDRKENDDESDHLHDSQRDVAAGEGIN